MREKDRESDLPAPALEGNVFQKFERSLPFARTYVDTVEKRVRAAADDLKAKGEGDGKSVTVEALQKAFTTAAWADLGKEGSRTNKLVTHAVFADDNGKISVNKLILFAVLNSPGTSTYKSEVLFNVLQEGGSEVHKALSHNDKDILPNLA